jgi:hypothetical protein
MPPTSERYYTGSLSLGDVVVWLTSDMSDTGLPARIELSGDDAFEDIIGETITEASDGAVHSQAVIVGVVGIRFEIKILFCPQTLYDALVSMITATRGTGAQARVQLTSVKREIDCQAIANGNNWLSTGRFSGSVIQDVTIRLISTAGGGE